MDAPPSTEVASLDAPPSTDASVAPPTASVAKVVAGDTGAAGNEPAVAPEIGAPHAAVADPIDATPISDSTVDAIARGVGESLQVPDDKPVATRRQHVDALTDEARAEVTVHAPGYEKMLSSSRWEDLPLPPSIIRGAYAKGWERPSKIQAQSLPYILRGDHPSLLAQAKNGSGKTGSFGLAMLAAADPKIPRVQSLCLSPTRELAIQTTRVLQQLAQFSGLQIVSVIGGVRYTQPIAAQVVVATPGKIQEVLKNRILDLSSLKVFVLDEADDMIENFAGECSFVKRAASVRRNPPQTLLFSASFECLEPSHPHATRAKNFTDLIIDRKQREPVIIRVLSVEGLRLENVTQFTVDLRSAHSGRAGQRSESAEFDAKLRFLLAMYDTMTVGKTMIFVATRSGATTLASAMRAAGHAPSVITGSRDVAMEERLRVQEEFENGITKVLICTDLMTRGIDVPGMKLVINFDLPFEYTGGGPGPRQPDFATFQHRSGRVGRFGQVGAVVNLIASDGDADALGQLAQHFALPLRSLPAQSPEDASVAVEDAMARPPAAPARG